MLQLTLLLVCTLQLAYCIRGSRTFQNGCDRNLDVFCRDARDCSVGQYCDVCCKRGIAQVDPDSRFPQRIRIDRTRRPIDSRSSCSRRDVFCRDDRDCDVGQSCDTCCKDSGINDRGSPRSCGPSPGRRHSPGPGDWSRDRDHRERSRSYSETFYYDTKSRRCRQFWGGYDGDGNIYDSLLGCELQCEGDGPDDRHRPGPRTPSPDDDCVEYRSDGRTCFNLNPAGWSCLPYKGRRSRTKSDRRCQNWSSSWPHKHSYGYIGNHNECRSDGSNQPWCYTNQSNVRWEYCFDLCS